MTLLRTGFFFSKSTWSPPVVNAAPSISEVTLNFDFGVNEAPVGQNTGLVFDVIAGNAAPMISAVTLNFDYWTNTKPVGDDVDLTFNVIAADADNSGPVGQDQVLTFEVGENNAAPVITTVTLNFDFLQNTKPVGADTDLTFDVIAGDGASNAAPAGLDQTLMFVVAA